MANKVESIEGIANLRQSWQRFVTNVVGGEFVKPVTMVNNGYLHALNASFDGLFLREQQSNSLLTANHPMNFGTAQPCVRAEDRSDTKASPLHLGIFEIWGTSVLGFEHVTPPQMADITIREFLTFYTDFLGMDSTSLRIYYFGGGTLKEITGGKSQSNEYIKPDDFSVDLWAKYGVGENQLTPEYSNETFLLHMGNPTKAHHSGYRNDIYFDIGKQQFEIATLNFISHQSVVEDRSIISVKPLPFYLREIAIGQERIISAMNESANVFELSHIAPLVAACTQIAEEPTKATVLADSIRAIHYIVSDGWTHNKLAGQRLREHRQEFSSFMKVLVSNPEISGEDFRKLLELNASLQPWHQSLKSGVEPTLGEISLYKTKRKGAV